MREDFERKLRINGVMIEYLGKVIELTRKFLNAKKRSNCKVEIKIIER